MKNMKLAFIFLFLMLAIAAMAYKFYLGGQASDERAAAESASASCGDQAVAAVSPSDKAFMEAEELMGNAEFKDAGAALEDAIKQFPGEARFYNLLGQALMYQNDIERALAALKKAVAFEPGNLKFIFDLASLQFKVEMFEDAASTIEAVSARTIDDPMQAVLAVNICVQNNLPEAGLLWSERALTLLTPETDTYGYVLTRKALFLSMLGETDQSLHIINDIKFDQNNEDKLVLVTALKAGFIRWLGNKPGEREKMLAELAAATSNELAADTVRLTQALTVMEDSKWAEAAAFLSKSLPAPAPSDNATKVFHYLMRQGINVIALDKTGKSEAAKALVNEMKTWCDNNSKGGGRILVSRCRMVELLSRKNDIKEAIDICDAVPPSLKSACLLNAGFGSEMNGDDDSAWEFYSKSAENARYNAFPKKISRVLLKNINDSRKAASESSR